MAYTKSASGIYHAEFRRAALQGGRLALSLRTKSRAEARRRHDALSALLDAGRFDIVERLRSGEVSIAEIDRALVPGGRGVSVLEVAHEGVTLERARDLFRDELKLQKAPDSTVAAYEGPLAQLLDHFGAERPLASIPDAALLRWMASLSLAPRSQRFRKSLYARLWRLAIRTEKKEAKLAGTQPRLLENPWRDVKVAKVVDEREHAKRILTPAQATAVLEANRGHKECAFLALAYLAGLRQQESAHLRIEDIDLERRLLHIGPHTKPVRWKPKTSNSKRSIPIAAQLVELLEEHAALGFCSPAYWFTGSHPRRPIGRTTANHWMKRAYGRAGIDAGRKTSGVVYHTGRHSFASWALAAGEPATRVADYIGDTVETLLDTYAHVLPDSKGRVRDAIEGILAPVSRESSRSGAPSSTESK